MLSSSNLKQKLQHNVVSISKCWRHRNLDGWICFDDCCNSGQPWFPNGTFHSRDTLLYEAIWQRSFRLANVPQWECYFFSCIRMIESRKSGSIVHLLHTELLRICKTSRTLSWDLIFLYISDTKIRMRRHALMTLHLPHLHSLCLSMMSYSCLLRHFPIDRLSKWYWECALFLCSPQSHCNDTVSRVWYILSKQVQNRCHRATRLPICPSWPWPAAIPAMGCT